MRAIIQRVTDCSLEIDGKIFSSISHGLLVLVGIEDSDSPEDMEWLSGKIARLRIFDDAAGVMNCPVTDVQGEVMLVSQFTLHASTKKGNRPSYIRASKPETAIPLYEAFIKQMESDLGQTVKTGQFGAHMNIRFTNNGPVTIFLDTKNKE